MKPTDPKRYKAVKAKQKSPPKVVPKKQTSGSKQFDDAIQKMLKAKQK